MSFKEISTLDADVTISLGGVNRKTGKKNPLTAEGYYLGSRKVDSQKSKSGFAFIHFLQTSKGNLGIWGKTDMDRKFTSVVAGTMVRVSFDKMVPTPKGEMYKYKLEVDSSNTIEVASTTDNSGDLDSNDEETSGTDFEVGGYSANAELDEEDTAGYEADEATQTNALSALERKAKVEALLKGKPRTTRN